MGVIALHRKLAKLNTVLQDMVEECFEELEDYIIELNQEQLAEGRRSDSGYMPPYSDTSILIKKNEGKSIFSGRVALHDTGSFWDNMFISVYQNSVEFGSNDSKADMLFAEYGKTIYGLAYWNYPKFAERFNPLLHKKMIDFLRTA